MVRNRLIFSLLFDDGYYNLSRNFRLQRVGNLDWVLENYDFDSIARSIDELVILDVSRTERQNIETLSNELSRLGRNCFMPFAVGGGIRTLDHALKLFKAGADKVILNTAYFLNPDLVRELGRIVGVQSIVASLDYRLETDGERRVYINNGSEASRFPLMDAVRYVQDVGAGEIYLTSIDNDGTGKGFDLEALGMVAPSCSVPIIASGGAGNHMHFNEALKSGLVSAVSTANLFNFMGDGLADARLSLLEDGVDLSVWDFSALETRAC
jgi:imidazole glycerol-phosphate synthase subunit HisF